MAKLDLSSFTGMMEGSSSGPVIAPGKPERSLMWKLIETGQMPQGGKLTAAEKQLIKSYIQYGRFPQATAETEAAARAREAAKITPEGPRTGGRSASRSSPPVPSVAAKDQVRTPIDAFVLAQLEHKGWKMQSEADRPTLIRRAYFDLIGLPPTPAEVKAFVDDQSPNAWEKVIDHLLASPHYGEQWGRHWLDVAGYSDSRGDAGDSDREVSWKYRDYVIHAFNRTSRSTSSSSSNWPATSWSTTSTWRIPTPDQIEPLTATGFMRTTADITDNQTIYEVDKYFDAQQKAMETSLTALMGVTIQCARCHDHKFDPFLQRDYYKLMAIYQPVWDPENWLPADLNHGPWPSRMVLDMDEATRAAWIKDVTSNDAKALRRMDDLLEATYQKYRGELKAGRDISERSHAPADAQGYRGRSRPGSRPQRAQGCHHRPGNGKALSRNWRNGKTRSRLKRYERRNQSKVPPNYIEASWDISKTPSPTYILARGNYLAPGAEVQPGLPLVLDNPQHPLEFPDSDEASGMERHQSPADSGEVDGLARESPGAARVRESRLGVALRRRNRTLGGRFRRAGRKADSPRIARLSDGKFRGA